MKLMKMKYIQPAGGEECQVSDAQSVMSFVLFLRRSGNLFFQTRLMCAMLSVFYRGLRGIE